MTYLVDTNVFSELAKPKPDAQVVAWLRDHEQDLYVSTITIGELRRGIERLTEGKKERRYKHGSPASANGWTAEYSVLTPTAPTSGAN